MGLGRSLAILLVFIFFAACGDKGLTECDEGEEKSTCSKLTKEERARRALDNGDYELAKELLNEMIAESETPSPVYHSLLATAYAGLAGFEMKEAILAVLKDPNSDFAVVLGSLLPDRDSVDPPFANALSYLELATNIVESALLQGEPYSPQRLFYNTAVSIMKMKKTQLIKPDGSFSAENLDNLSDEEIVDMADNLESAVKAVASNPNDPLAQKATEAIGQLEGKSEAEKKEALRDFLEKRDKSQPIPTEPDGPSQTE